MVEPVGDQFLDGISGPVDLQVELLALRTAEVAEHEGRGLHPPRRTADADPDPVELPGPEGAADGLEPVVPVVAAAELEPQAAEREVELVVDDDEPFQRDLK